MFLYDQTVRFLMKNKRKCLFNDFAGKPPESREIWLCSKANVAWGVQRNITYRAALVRVIAPSYIDAREFPPRTRHNNLGPQRASLSAATARDTQMDCFLAPDGSISIRAPSNGTVQEETEQPALNELVLLPATDLAFAIGEIRCASGAPLPFFRDALPSMLRLAGLDNPRRFSVVERTFRIMFDGGIIELPLKETVSEFIECLRMLMAILGVETLEEWVISTEKGGEK